MLLVLVPTSLVFVCVCSVPIPGPVRVVRGSRCGGGSHCVGEGRPQLEVMVEEERGEMGGSELW